MQNSQNLARQRAAKFGQQDEIDGSDPSLKVVHPHTLQSPSASVLVTTTSLKVEFDMEDWHDDEDFLAKPRGYFADQFEVRELIAW